MVYLYTLNNRGPIYPIYPKQNSRISTFISRSRSSCETWSEWKWNSKVSWKSGRTLKMYVCLYNISMHIYVYIYAHMVYVYIKMWCLPWLPPCTKVDNHWGFVSSRCSCSSWSISFLERKPFLFGSNSFAV